MDDPILSLSNGAADSYNVEELQNQIEILKKVIHDKNIQLNMVIKHAEEKYHDIHKNYRDLANELHNSWKHKYEKLERENNRLSNSLALIIKQNKMKTDEEIQENGKNKALYPISNGVIPIENIAESLDLDEVQLNQLNGGNIKGNDEKNKKISKPKIKNRVLETYID